MSEVNTNQAGSLVYVDNKTKHLSLPLPNAKNDLVHDVERIESSFVALDENAKKVDESIESQAIKVQGIENSLGEQEQKVNTALSSVQEVQSSLQKMQRALDEEKSKISSNSSSIENVIQSVADLEKSVEEQINSIPVPEESVPLDLLVFMPQLFSGTFDGVNPIGKSGKIFTEWQLCDGTNGTPDLRDRFILGGDGSNTDETGGSSTHTHSVSGSVGATVLSWHQMPSHAHSALVAGGNSILTNSNYTGSPASSASTGTAGANHGHTHSFSGSAVVGNHTPPYYTLAYIMYIGV